MAQLTGEGGEAGDALRRVQTFDPESLVRESELGFKFALRECVEPARKVIDLFKLITPSQISYFPLDQQNQILTLSNGFYSLLDQCLKFDIEAQPAPTDAKNTLVQQIIAQYQPIFNQIYPLISFVSARTQDFSQLERDARAATQSAKDNVATALNEIGDAKASVDVILGEVRAMAAEQGVSKQAIYFKGEADSHGTNSEKWLKYTIYVAIFLVIFATLSLFSHNISGLDPRNPYQAIQITTSKFLIFAVIGFMLFLCSRNFLSHKHNEVVNRHRQNALATFTALAEATSDAASSDIVLSHAAACIFSPQDTGYIKSTGSHGDSVPGLQLIPRIGELVKASH